ncbi:microtubule-binding protein MIP-T3-domain-containing protein [Paraphysoderma sedebokerense]|nr:microtubule-binding protein MIP-T3-domain-containing protein [Paraphysoderma sedebokerense]
MADQDPLLSITNDTTSLLSPFLTKTPLSHKLLSKPPFRYLHDIIIEIITSTGYQTDLFSETEMNSENVKAKEDKLKWLDKVVAVVAKSTNDQVKAKPSKIIAGLEPEETNKLLQLFAQCVHEFVKSSGSRKVQSTDTPAANLSSTAHSMREETSKEKEDKKDVADPEVRGNVASAKVRDQEKLKPESDKDSEKQKRSGSKSAKSGKDTGKQKERGKDSSKVKSSSKSRSTEGEKARESKDISKRSSSSLKEKEKEKDRSKRKDKSSEEDGKQRKKRDTDDREKLDKERDRRDGRERERENAASAKSDTRRSAEVLDGGIDDESLSLGVGQSQEIIQSNQDVASSLIALSENIPKDPEENRKAISEEEYRNEKAKYDPEPGSLTTSKLDIHERKPPLGSSTSASILTSESTRRPARPSTARAPPPRIRSARVVDFENDARYQASQPQIITDIRAGQNMDEDDNDDQYVVMAPESNQNTIPAVGRNSSATNNENDGQHGMLVRKMLEVKKELTENTTGSDSRPSNIHQSREMEKDAAKKEIESLRTHIQSLCQHTNPLGKIMDYLAEDMDSMTKELESWKKENQRLKGLVEVETRATEDTLSILQNQLKELEISISEQRNKISEKKSKVLENEEKIFKMVATIAESR